LLDRVGDRLAQRYAGSVRGLGLQQRVTEMAGALEERGVLTDNIVQADGSIVLTAYNCPYHELAQQHREICEMDEKMMRSVLGSDVTLSSCMMDGHARCSFVVRPAQVSEAA
jgi:predicted ArsR family transcriptional regulator